jgi:hypothetical protein
MRTTLDIDDDVLAAAKERGRAEGKTAGQIISDLARQALTKPHNEFPGLAEGQSAYTDEDALFPRFPKRGGVIITTEHVRKVQDEIDGEDAKRAARTSRGEPPD